MQATDTGAFGRLMSYLNFQRSRYSGMITCPDRPHFENQASTDYFEMRLREATTYLEYGSGGSTVLAVELGKRVVSVDSDRMFLGKVREALRRHTGQASQVSLLYANIGFTREWGQPVFTSPTRERLARWMRYSEMPWIASKQTGQLPELVLVDGRFRVACALRSFQHLAQKPDALIIVDDYVGRDWYSEIGRFGELVERIGRMAAFRPKVADPEEVEISIQRHVQDWR